MLRKSLTTITIISIFMLTTAIVYAGKNITICHVPPGNHDNAHTITVGSEAAAKAHLAHGDSTGACSEPTEPPPTATEPPPTATEPSPTATEPSPTATEPSPTATEPTGSVDTDGDGFFDSIDCEPTNPAIYPGSPQGDCGIVFHSGELQFTLVWDNMSDLGLEVVEPSGELIRAQNPVSATFGTLDFTSMDACFPNPVAIENIYWANNAPVGTYQFRVVTGLSCGATTAANWIITVRVNGSIVAQHSGTGSSVLIPYNYTG